MANDKMENSGQEKSSGKLDKIRNLTNKVTDRVKNQEKLGFRVITIIVILIATGISVYLAVLFGKSVFSDKKETKSEYHEPYHTFDVKDIVVYLVEPLPGTDDKQIRLTLNASVDIAYPSENIQIPQALSDNRVIIIRAIYEVFQAQKIEVLLDTEKRQSLLKDNIKKEVNRIIKKCSKEKFEQYCGEEEKLMKQRWGMTPEELEELKNNRDCSCEGLSDEGVAEIFITKFQTFIQKN